MTRVLIVLVVAGLVACGPAQRVEKPVPVTATKEK